MDGLDGLFQVFLLIFMVGSGIASWLKKRHEDAAKREAPPQGDLLELPEEFEEEEIDLEELLRRRSRPAPGRRPAPAPPPVPRATPRPAEPPAPHALGGLRSSLALHDFGEASFAASIESSFDTSSLSTLEAELDARKLGHLEVSAAETVATRAAWRPSSGSWREAVILREVLGPPVALREPNPAGTPS